jgi:hypothetical protein
MPTIEQARKWAADFERAYPEELPDRLRWFVESLGVRPNHLLRLMGAPREQVQLLAEGAIDWRWAVRQFGEGSAWWAESAIRQAIVLYQYDWRALKGRLSRPVDREFEVAAPGGHGVALRDLPADRREEALLGLIAQDGPQSSSALVAYLSQPDQVRAGS